MKIVTAAHALALYDAWLDEGPRIVLDGVSYLPSELRKAARNTHHQGALLRWMAPRGLTVDWARDWTDYA